MLSNKTGGRLVRWAAAGERAGHWLGGGEQLFSFASLDFLGFCFPLYVFFSFPYNFKKLLLFLLNY